MSDIDSPAESTFYAFSSYGGSSLEPPTTWDGSIGWYLERLLSDCGAGSDPGRSPRPFAHFIAKVASRCNIACAYCYMYEHADQTWRNQPTFMSDDTESRLIERVGEYLAERELPGALVILHGGEPLLYGPQRIDRFANRLSAMRRHRGVGVDLALQTNATMVDDAFLDVAVRHRIRVGVSLDGPPTINDAVRRDRLGRGTYDRVASGLRRLVSAAADGLTPPAVTAVIDPTISPRQVVEHMLELGVIHMDFQLPDHTHDTYPFDRWPPGTFGTWLIELYELLRTTRRRVRVRSMELLVRLLTGASCGGDILGASSYGTLVVDSDGAYHAHDALRVTRDGVTATGRSVQTDKISLVESHPMVLAFTDKASAAAQECLDCSLFPVCGGGLVSHRHGRNRGFDNRSVYCTDLTMVIKHVGHSIEQSRRLLDETRRLDSVVPT